MAKSIAAPSPARAQLAKAHDDRSAAVAVLNEAEEAHATALRDYRHAQAAVMDIEDRIKEINAMPAYTWQHREQIATKLEETRAPMREAKLPLMSLGMAEEAAQAKVREAENRLSAANGKVNDAADGVIREAADPVVAGMIERISAAMDIILTEGPQLDWLKQEEMMPPASRAAANAIIGKLRSNPIGWAGYEQQHRANPWRASRESLKSHPDASLPVGDK